VAHTDTYELYNTYRWSGSYGCKIERIGSSGSYSYSVASGYANRPVNYVSWGDSARFSNWLHNNQPTGTQNASTTEDGAYALNGATSNAVLLAVSRETDATWALTSEDEWYKATYYKGGETNAGYFDYPTSSDTAPGQDMADASGNNANYFTAPHVYPIDSPYYTTVGGNYSDDYLHASSRNRSYPTYEYDNVGFRVSEVPEPASILMLALGRVGILRKRR